MQFLLRLMALLALAPVLVAGQRGNLDRRPNFAGIWNSATATQLERPRELRDQPFFSPEEAAKWEGTTRREGTACREGVMVPASVERSNAYRIAAS